MRRLLDHLLQLWGRDGFYGSDSGVPQDGYNRQQHLPQVLDLLCLSAAFIVLWHFIVVLQ